MKVSEAFGKTNKVNFDLALLLVLRLQLIQTNLLSIAIFVRSFSQRDYVNSSLYD